MTIGAKVKSSWNPGTAVITPTQPTTTTKYYRVRKSWADKSSQIGAFTVFQNAKNCVDANPGYAVFDDNGNQVYPEAASTPYLVRITIPDLNYRKGPSTAYDSYGYIEPGVYTIVDEQDGWGLLKAYAQERPSEGVGKTPAPSILFIIVATLDSDFTPESIDGK